MNKIDELKRLIAEKIPYRCYPMEKLDEPTAFQLQIADQIHALYEPYLQGEVKELLEELYKTIANSDYDMASVIRCLDKWQAQLSHLPNKEYIPAYFHGYANRARAGLEALPKPTNEFWKGYWQGREELITQLKNDYPNGLFTEK